jgi:hypothetical protein
LPRFEALASATGGTLLRRGATALVVRFAGHSVGKCVRYLTCNLFETLPGQTSFLGGALETLTGFARCVLDSFRGFSGRLPDALAGGSQRALLDFGRRKHGRNRGPGREPGHNHRQRLLAQHAAHA